ncbi:alkaline phosphatase family protein [Parabacteroides acidifaciens]|uniref:Alkaline phosphatase family protein n=1 Tax=Parabacteroides acidifaciens TaxID=2290935 RepID=A0A3D8HCB1_9BACT|nr:MULTISPECIES: ectonucleotide pyrophosphatase/phosphodiesterase [Parabacteroides]MBC8603106.1 alkaline phosphatase family protein [Parabacteroides acidifaciens]RDU48167.1 alkaline phosphatase family protein [Parabacteroides acidifaciens]RHO75212.1 alkaline phosphatase family protein [Parabacteroides sp. AF48-14]
MYRFLTVILIGLFSIIYLSIAGCTAHSKKEHYVVVLSMDGFRSDYPLHAHTPTLDSLARVGVKAAFRPSFPSVTFPNHYSMATGLHPDHHGLVSNFFYAPDLDSIYLLGKPNPDFFGGEPIWNTAEKQGVRTASFYWVGSEYPIQGRQPSVWKPFDKNVPFSDRADSVIAWLQLPEKVRPHLIMWYMEEPDAIGHKVGPDAAETLSTVEELDRILGDFFAKARKLKIFNKIDFIVLSDHGMATIHPENFVNLSDYLPRDSFEYVFDGVPTLLYPKPTYTDSAYAILKRVPHITVWKKNEIPEKYVYGKNPRVGDLFVQPDVGTYVLFRPGARSTLAATHGYDNYAPEMEAIFYAAGPSFKQNVELPVMANVNLYLMIARLLNLQPAPNDGDSAVVSTLFRKEK